ALTKPNAGIVRNAILSAFTGLEIVDSVVAGNEPPIALSSLEKAIRLDVNCTTADGKQLNIEMQAQSMEADNLTNQHENLCIRSVHYASKLFVSQESTLKYSDLKQTFQIILCDFSVFGGIKEDEKFIHRFTFSDDNLQLTDKIIIVFVELPKIKKLINTPTSELSAEEKWALYIEFFGNKDFYGKVSEFENKEEFKMAKEILSNISQNEEERFRYLSRLKFQTDLTHNQAAARDEGIKQGKTEGLLEAAKNALKKGLTFDIVADITGLPMEEIEKLSLA
ncbi:MAG: Rpn family recombination-promoting nuclease/putative transposase, partial [Oscillospiraceae bacterium]|nr:Rpn family recombination-promoting nuclease/putative transposase [Oscillospiraceae bacterium]